MIRRVLVLIFFFLTFINLTANETRDRHIRMLINERTGRFALYFLVDPIDMTYRPLFNRRSATSFIDVNVNGVAHRLGSSRIFNTIIDRNNEDPIITYESPLLNVNKTFTPIRTTSSHTANGVQLTITVQNKSEEEISVGLRMLIDTYLGERRRNIPFVTDNLNITRETIIEGSAEELYWISRGEVRGEMISLMGSISEPMGILRSGDGSYRVPDFLHFANWKKLSDVPWKAPYHEGRSFNLFPYSIGDSSVCYYWEPEILDRGRSLTYTVYLTTMDIPWYTQPYIEIVRPVRAPEPVEILEAAIETMEAVIEASTVTEETDLQALRRLRGILAQFIAGEIELDEHDLIEIETSIDRHGR